MLDRRSLALLGGGAVVLIVLVVALSSGESGTDIGAAERSSLENFPTRGELAGDQDLLDAAAAAWESSERVADGEFEAPQESPEALWAGEVEARFQDGSERLVVLYDESAGALATVYFGEDGEDGSVMSVEEQPPPASAVATQDVLLVAANLPPIEAITTSSSPREPPARDEVDPEVGLIADPADGTVVVPQAENPARAGDEFGQVPLISASGGEYVVAPEDWREVRGLLLEGGPSADLLAALGAAGQGPTSGQPTPETALTPLYAGTLADGLDGVIVATGEGISAGVGLGFLDPGGDSASSSSFVLAEPEVLDPTVTADGTQADRPTLAAQLIDRGPPALGRKPGCSRSAATRRSSACGSRPAGTRSSSVDRARS